MQRPGGARAGVVPPPSIVSSAAGERSLESEAMSTPEPHIPAVLCFAGLVPRTTVLIRRRRFRAHGYTALFS